MPNWQGSTRKERLPPGWAKIRVRILRRDNYMCQHLRVDTGRKCQLPATDVDHRHPGDDHSDANLQALCDWHHLRKSGAEGGRAAQKKRRENEAATPVRHPGLIDPPTRR